MVLMSQVGLVTFHGTVGGAPRTPAPLRARAGVAPIASARGASSNAIACAPTARRSVLPRRDRDRRGWVLAVVDEAGRAIADPELWLCGPDGIWRRRFVGDFRGEIHLRPGSAGDPEDVVLVRANGHATVSRELSCGGEPQRIVLPPAEKKTRRLP